MTAARLKTAALVSWGFTLSVITPGVSTAQASAVLSAEFVAKTMPTPSVHASTIAEGPGGVMIAWFGGSREGAADVGIWLSRTNNGVLGAPTLVATGAQSGGSQFACYNPVLFRSRDNTLHLFYKVGPQPAKWWGMHQSSRDDGKTWSAAERLPDGILGPVKNKPLMLKDGTLIAGSSTESTDADPRWRVHFEISHDNAKTWTIVRPDSNATSQQIDAIQPSVLTGQDGQLLAVGRTRSQRVFVTRSRDNGATWSALSLTDVPNPNAGTDAVTLRDGRQLLVYNNSTTSRTPLVLALSTDGVSWRIVETLESAPGEYSYPAIVQTRDGLVHVTYTWQRTNIRHVLIDPRRIH